MASGGTINLLQLLGGKSAGGGAATGIGTLLGGPVGFGIGAGVDLIGSLLGVRSERRRLEELRAEFEEAQKPLETALETRKTGLSQTEGKLAEGATTGALTDLASRNVLESSFAPGEVLRETAPLELRRQESVQGLERELAASRMAIAGATSLPGYGAAVGGTLGDVGEFLALRGGRDEGRERSRRLMQEKLDSLLELLS
jgi:hypothetical protein